MEVQAFQSQPTVVFSASTECSFSTLTSMGFRSFGVGVMAKGRNKSGIFHEKLCSFDP